MNMRMGNWFKNDAANLMAINNEKSVTGEMIPVLRRGVKMEGS